jgi:glucokinase
MAHGGARLAGGVDIGATGTKLGVVAADGSIRSQTTVATRAKGPALVEEIAGTLGRLLDDAASLSSPVRGVGVAVAGFLDRGRATMVQNANLPGLRHFPLRRALEDRLGVECRLEVDSNASTVAEHRFGAGRGAARLLGVTVGTGLGGGVIVEGRLLRFTGECAGDLGHIVLDPYGRACTCGARGCIEALVCAAALSERAGGRQPRDVIAAARAGERGSLDALVETGRWLGRGLASLAPLFAPDTIVVGGGIAVAGDALLDPARTSFRERASPDFASVRIAGSTFDGWEGMVGAASLFLDPLD